MEDVEIEQRPAPPLTNREREVLAEVAAGRTTIEVAFGLGISPLTVKGHLRAVMAKLGAHSTAEAVTRAYALGLARPPEGLGDAIERLEGERGLPEPAGDATAALGEVMRRAREAARVGASLTARELEVLRCIGAGLTTRLAASRLGISERTVQSHLSRLYAKLGARSRVGAVVEATRLGLLDRSS